MDLEQTQSTRFSFGDFDLDANRRLLLSNGEPVALNYRAFELLLALVERRGNILSKDELLETVWNGQFVEEANLTVHISALRKALGETKNENKYIVTVPGRGYSFVAELNSADENGFVLESHSLSRIYVEEEISDDSEIQLAQTKELGAKPAAVSLIKENWFFVAVPVLLIVAVAVIGGYFLLKKNSVPFQHMTIKRLTSSGNISRAALSPDGKLFAYTIPEGENESLWLGHVDGGEPMRIRPPASKVYLSLKFTPDGSSLYYTVGENYGDGTLYRIPVFGGAPEKVRDNFRSLTFGPDGKQFVFLRYDEDRQRPVVLSADPKGGNEKEIAVLPSDVGAAWHNTSWSPDGATIAFSVTVKADDNGIFVLNTKDGSTRRLSTQPWKTLDAITWLRDSSGLIAAGVGGNGALRQLWFVSFPGGEVHRLTNDLTDWGYITSLANDNSLLVVQGVSQSNVWVAPANDLKDAKQITFGSPGRKDGWNTLVWTQDGRIVYTADTNDGSTILIMNPDGTKQKQLIPNGGLNSLPSLTSDGRSMVFQSNRSGHFAVWRADMDGGNMAQVTGEQIAGQPQVSPDGKWILYNSHIDSPGDLWRIPASGGEPFHMIDRPADWAFISPDSKSVACEVEIEDKIKLAIISLNDGQLIRMFDVPRLANLRLGVHWTPDGQSVAYRDWSNGIWRQNLAGGEPHRLDGLPEEKLLGYGWSADGKTFAYTRGNTSRDVVLITNKD